MPSAAPTAKRSTTPTEPKGPAVLTVALAAGDIQPMGGGETHEAQRLRISTLAYSGGVFHSYGTKMVIDLTTLEEPKDKLPFLYQHNYFSSRDDNRLGWTTRCDVTEKGIEIDAEFLARLMDDTIVKDLKDGYPFELSVRVDSGGYIWVEPGATLTVNNAEFDGPGYVLQQGRLRELSLCEIGADANTEMALLSERAGRLGLQVLPGSSTDTPEEPGGASLSHGGTGMTATIEQLKTLGGTAEFTLKALEAKLSLEQAAVELCGAQAKSIAELSARHTQAVAELNKQHTQELSARDAQIDELKGKLDHALKAGGSAPLKLSGTPAGGAGAGAAGGAGGEIALDLKAELSGTDPEADWAASETLQAHFKDHGGKGAFLRFAALCANEREDYRVLYRWKSGQSRSAI